MPIKEKLKKNAPVLIAVGVTATVAVAATSAVIIRRNLIDQEKVALAAIDVIMDLGGDPQTLIPAKVMTLWPSK